MRVLIAPDKFKGSLSADEVAAALEAGFVAERPDTAAITVPIADGGDGTLAAAQAAGFTSVPVRAVDAVGRVTGTSYARRGAEAVIELAAVAGLAGLTDLAPLGATTRGVGEVVAAALDAGCRRIVVGLGGSASTDGGAGLLVGLGARLVDADGRPVGDGGRALHDVAALDLAGLHPALDEAEIIVATDVDSPLTGPLGAAHVYAPQKGADASQVEVLDAALAHWADVVAAATGRDHRDAPGAGAAGGTAYTLTAVLGGTRRPGADVVFEMVGLADQIAEADLVITGEGRLDRQTLLGKGPGAVAALGRAAGIPVLAVAGRVDLGPAELAAAGFATAYSLVDLVGEDRCWSHPARVLADVGREIARGHAVPLPGRPTA